MLKIAEDARVEYAKNDIFYNLVKYEPEKILESDLLDSTLKLAFEDEDISLYSKSTALEMYTKDILDLMFYNSILEDENLGKKDAYRMNAAVNFAFKARSLKTKMILDHLAAEYTLGLPDPSKETFELARTATDLTFGYVSGEIIHGGIKAAFKVGSSVRDINYLRVRGSR